MPVIQNNKRGWKWQSKNGHLFLSLNSPEFLFHLEIYRFAVFVEQNHTKWAAKHGPEGR